MVKILRSQFLPAITTTSESDWHAKIHEIKTLGLNQVALFLTCLDAEQRSELYNSLAQETGNLKIPFVHLRSDMRLEELDLLTQKYQTQVFNLHPPSEFPIEFNYQKYQDRIYIENTPLVPWIEEELVNFAGVCLDFAHLEDNRRLSQDTFLHNTQILKKYRIGCNHISGATEETHYDAVCDRDLYNTHLVRGNFPIDSDVDFHNVTKFSELDYLKNYPLNYFSRFNAIELENSLVEQLQIIDYILSLFN